MGVLHSLKREKFTYLPQTCETVSEHLMGNRTTLLASSANLGLKVKTHYSFKNKYIKKIIVHIETFKLLLLFFVTLATYYPLKRLLKDFKIQRLISAILKKNILTNYTVLNNTHK